MIQNINIAQAIMLQMAKHIGDFVRFEYTYGNFNTLSRIDMNTMDNLNIQNGNMLTISATHSVGFQGGNSNDLKTMTFIVNPA